MNKSSTNLTIKIPSVVTRSRIALPLSMLAALCFSSAQATPDLTTYIAINEPSTARTMESTGASLTDSASGPRNNVYAYTSYGSINVSGQGSAPASPENPGFGGSMQGNFINGLQFNNPLAARARITFHLTGQVTAASGGTAFMQNGYTINVNNNVHGG